MTTDLAVMLGKRFLQRRDVKSEQGRDGGWYTKETPWKMSDLRDHLEGKRTLGHYLIDDQDKCKLFAFDLDLVKEGTWLSLKEDELMGGGQPCNPREAWIDPAHPAREYLTLQLRCMADALAMKIVRVFDGDFPVAIAYSGSKGLHVYGFCGEMPAAEARGAAMEVLNSFGCFELSKGKNFFRHQFGEYRNIEVEVYPKQDTLEGQRLGNLMALPLGIHRKTGLKKYFIDSRVGYSILKELDPIKALEGEMPPWGGTYTDAI